LLEARGDLVSVLRLHCGKCAQNDQIERALQELDRSRLFTWHPSSLLERQDRAGITCLSSEVVAKDTSLQSESDQTFAGLSAFYHPRSELDDLRGWKSFLHHKPADHGVADLLR
jgi:hypothetical protein